jgi:hypothetical protein
MSCINLFLGLFWYHRRLGHAVNAIAMEFLNRNSQDYWDMIGFAGYHFFEKKNSSSEVALQALVV